MRTFTPVRRPALSASRHPWASRFFPPSRLPTPHKEADHDLAL